MHVPDRLAPLIELGVITEVLRPLMSGKEAAVYLVDTPDGVRVAKVYKEATQRSFKHRADYTEGRKVRNSRTQRAMAKRSKYGAEQVEAAWQRAEVDAIYRCREAGVRVPEPFAFVDGVLVMELVADDEGEPAPRLVDVELDPRDAQDLFETLLRDMIRMLLAGVVHGDLSDFNILLASDGPVIIDLPQATDPAFNNNARKLFVRDVDNVTRFLARYAPHLEETRYGLEVWDLYERNLLAEDTPLTGRAPKRKKTKASATSALLEEIEFLEREARERREKAGIVRKAKFEPPKPTSPPPKPLDAAPSKRKRRRKKRRGDGDGSPPQGAPPKAPTPPPLPMDDLDAFLLVDDD